MDATSRLKRSFNWRMLLMRILVNMVALAVTALVVPKIYFDNNSLLAWVFMALGLGILNALIKPIIQFLTLRFIFVTAGLVLVLINTIMLFLLSWLLPEQLAVESIFWAAVGGLVLGLVNALLENLLGLSPPIVSDKYPEVRQRVKDRQFYRTTAEQTRIDAISRILPSTSSTGSAPVAANVPTLPEV